MRAAHIVSHHLTPSLLLTSRKPCPHQQQNQLHDAPANDHQGCLFPRRQAPHCSSSACFCSYRQILANASLIRSCVRSSCFMRSSIVVMSHN
ncbi:MAG: hypothetical protein ACK55I_09905, partial [bacterium]